MDYEFWFANWFSFLISFIILGLTLINLDNLGALKGIVFRLSFILVVAALLVCAYTNMTAKKIGAKCEDGWDSYSTGSGTCSHHGGVETWRYKYWFD